MRDNFTQLSYVIAAVLFILGLRSLTRPDKARQGMQMAAVGMLFAICGTLVCRLLRSGLNATTPTGWTRYTPKRCSKTPVRPPTVYPERSVFSALNPPVGWIVGSIFC